MVIKLTVTGKLPVFVEFNCMRTKDGKEFMERKRS